MVKPNHYAILGINHGASADEIKKAFRKKALLLHPDQGGSDQAFRELQEAFQYLISTSRPETVTSFDPTYDPFADLDYSRHSFFAPEHDHLAEFERSVRAQGCPICNGRGVVSKLVDPASGFFGREERFCKCQIVE